MTSEMASNSTYERQITSNIEHKVKPRKYEIVWRNVVVFSCYHLMAAYGLYQCFTTAMWTSILYYVFLYWLSIIGVVAGAHRLWSHRSYKASMPLQVFLMLCHSLANQHTVAHWVRDHRLHHKHSDTDADPHNSRRGFFYCHIGWLMVKKHPDVKEKGNGIDMTDIMENPVLMFQQRHANWFIIAMAFIIPSLIPCLWSESIIISFHINMLRYCSSLNAILLVNSVAHNWGYRPYDKAILPNQSLLVTVATLGEGFHNFHHVFPYDYRASELGNVMFNYVSVFIDVCALFGWAWDRKEVSRDIVEDRMKRTGDGTDLWGRIKDKYRS